MNLLAPISNCFGRSLIAGARLFVLLLVLPHYLSIFRLIEAQNRLLIAKALSSRNGFDNEISDYYGSSSTLLAKCGPPPQIAGARIVTQRITGGTARKPIGLLYDWLRYECDSKLMNGTEVEMVPPDGSVVVCRKVPDALLLSPSNNNKNATAVSSFNQNNNASRPEIGASPSSPISTAVYAIWAFSPTLTDAGIPNLPVCMPKVIKKKDEPQKEESGENLELSGEEENDEEEEESEQLMQQQQSFAIENGTSNSSRSRNDSSSETPEFSVNETNSTTTPLPKSTDIQGISGYPFMISLYTAENDSNVTTALPPTSPGIAGGTRIRSRVSDRKRHRANDTPSSKNRANRALTPAGRRAPRPFPSGGIVKLSDKADNSVQMNKEDANNSSSAEVKEGAVHSVKQAASDSSFQTSTGDTTTCGPPPDIPNSYVVSERIADGFRAGSPYDWVRYGCVDGYHIVGSEIVVCLMTGQWMNAKESLPFCALDDQSRVTSGGTSSATPQQQGQPQTTLPSSGDPLTPMGRSTARYNFQHQPFFPHYHDDDWWLHLNPNDNENDRERLPFNLDGLRFDRNRLPSDWDRDRDGRLDRPPFDRDRPHHSNEREWGRHSNEKEWPHQDRDRHSHEKEWPIKQIDHSDERDWPFDLPPPEPRLPPPSVPVPPSHSHEREWPHHDRDRRPHEDWAKRPHSHEQEWPFDKPPPHHLPHEHYLPHEHRIPHDRLASFEMPPLHDLHRPMHDRHHKVQELMLPNLPHLPLPPSHPVPPAPPAPPAPPVYPVAPAPPAPPSLPIMPVPPVPPAPLEIVMIPPMPHHHHHQREDRHDKHYDKHDKYNHHHHGQKNLDAVLARLFGLIDEWTQTGVKPPFSQPPEQLPQLPSYLAEIATPRPRSTSRYYPAITRGPVLPTTPAHWSGWNWNPSGKAMKLLTCGPPPPIPDSAIIASSLKTADDFGYPRDWVQYECSSKFELYSSDTVICMPDGRWMNEYGTLPLCIAPGDCSPPPDIPLATVDYINLSPGATATYYCSDEKDYAMIGHTNIVTCQRNATWTRPDFECMLNSLPRACDKPPLIKYGKIVQQSRYDNFGWSVTYACDNVAGPRYLRCHPYRGWGKPPLCPPPPRPDDSSTVKPVPY